MPIHDWTRVPAGTYHFLHQRWIQDIAAALNGGGLPDGYFAMSEVAAKEPMPDLLVKAHPPMPPNGPAGFAVVDAPPRARVVSRAENTAGYARRADRLSVYLPQGELIAVIEIVSPGNKDNTNGLRAFVRKAGKLLRCGGHLLIVDLFPPSVRDPQGIHKAIWDQFNEESFELPPDKPFTLAAYAAGSVKVAYIDNVAVGDRLVDMPIFLTPDHYPESSGAKTPAGKPELRRAGVPQLQLAVAPACRSSGLPQFRLAAVPACRSSSFPAGVRRGSNSGWKAGATYVPGRRTRKSG